MKSMEEEHHFPLDGAPSRSVKRGPKAIRTRRAGSVHRLQGLQRLHLRERGNEILGWPLLVLKEQASLKTPSRRPRVANDVAEEVREQLYLSVVASHNGVLNLDEADVVGAHANCRLRMMEGSVCVPLLDGSKFVALLPKGSFLLDCLFQNLKTCFPSL